MIIGFQRLVLTILALITSLQAINGEIQGLPIDDAFLRVAIDIAQPDVFGVLTRSQQVSPAFDLNLTQCLNAPSPTTSDVIDTVLHPLPCAYTTTSVVSRSNLVTLLLKFTRPILVFESGDLTVHNGQLVDIHPEPAYQNNLTIFEVLIQLGASDTVTTVKMPEGSVMDGNSWNEASNTLSIVYDNSPPKPKITALGRQQQRNWPGPAVLIDFGERVLGDPREIINVTYHNQEQQQPVVHILYDALYGKMFLVWEQTPGGEDIIATIRVPQGITTDVVGNPTLGASYELAYSPYNEAASTYGITLAALWGAGTAFTTGGALFIGVPGMSLIRSIHHAQTFYWLSRLPSTRTPTQFIDAAAAFEFITLDFDLNGESDTTLTMEQMGNATTALKGLMQGDIRLPEELCLVNVDSDGAITISGSEQAADVLSQTPLPGSIDESGAVGGGPLSSEKGSATTVGGASLTVNSLCGPGGSICPDNATCTSEFAIDGLSRCRTWQWIEDTAKARGVIPGDANNFVTPSTQKGRPKEKVVDEQFIPSGEESIVTPPAEESPSLSSPPMNNEPSPSPPPDINDTDNNNEDGDGKPKPPSSPSDNNNNNDGDKETDENEDNKSPSPPPQSPSPSPSPAPTPSSPLPQNNTSPSPNPIDEFSDQLSPPEPSQQPAITTLCTLPEVPYYTDSADLTSSVFQGCANCLEGTEPVFDIDGGYVCVNTGLGAMRTATHGIRNERNLLFLERKAMHRRALKETLLQLDEVVVPENVAKKLTGREFMQLLHRHRGLLQEEDAKRDDDSEQHRIPADASVFVVLTHTAGPLGAAAKHGMETPAGTDNNNNVMVGVNGSAIEVLSHLKDVFATLSMTIDPDDTFDASHFGHTIFWCFIIFIAVLILHILCRAAILYAHSSKRLRNFPSVLLYPGLELLTGTCLFIILVAAGAQYLGSTNGTVAIGVVVGVLLPVAALILVAGFIVVQISKGDYSEKKVEYVVGQAQNIALEVEERRQSFGIYHSTLDRYNAAEVSLQAELHEQRQWPTPTFLERWFFTPVCGYDQKKVGQWRDADIFKHSFVARFGLFFSDCKYTPAVHVPGTYNMNYRIGTVDRGKGLPLTTGKKNRVFEIAQLMGSLVMLFKMVLFAMLLPAFVTCPGSTLVPVILLFIVLIAYLVYLRTVVPFYAKTTLTFELLSTVCQILTLICCFVFLSASTTDTDVINSMGITVLVIQSIALLAEPLFNIIQGTKRILSRTTKAISSTETTSNEDKLYTAVHDVMAHDPYFLARKFVDRWLVLALGRGLHKRRLLPYETGYNIFPRPHNILYQPDNNGLQGSNSPRKLFKTLSNSSQTSRGDSSRRGLLRTSGNPLLSNSNNSLTRGSSSLTIRIAGHGYVGNNTSGVLAGNTPPSNRSGRVSDFTPSPHRSSPGTPGSVRFMW